MIPPADKDLLISTRNIGKEVSFAPSLKNQGLILKRAARQGFYYPMLAIKHLNALSTGLSGKRNVFIPNINDFKTNTFQKVVIFVPGIKATVERRANDSLVVTRLELDPNESYLQIQRGSRVKPGVYKVSKGSEDIEVAYKQNGRITSQAERKVVVADTEYDTPAEAAQGASKKLDAMFGGSAALKCDFDLFYSPVGSKLGGMRNYNPTILTQGYAFAGLLADAMEQSKNLKGVEWTSELGGSVVLTQALQALVSKKVSFQGQNHIVKMHRPTTNPNLTLLAATQLGMLASKDIAKGNGNIRASVSALMTNAKRASNKGDPYTWNDYAKELADGTFTASGAVGALALGASAVISSPALVAVGAVTGAVGAFHFAFKTVKNRLGKG